MKKSTTPHQAFLAWQKLNEPAPYNCVRISFYSADLVAEIDKVRKITGKTRHATMREAIRMYINNFYEQEKANGFNRQNREESQVWASTR